MYTPLAALYDYATDRDDLTHWLPNEDIIDTYRGAAEYAHKQREQLLNCLSGEHAALFKKFAENADVTHQLESEMLFYQGLAMGLQLGTLPLWV